MGASPAWATLALTLPVADADFVAGFADGFAELATGHGLALVGGDTTRGPLAITVTALGLVPCGQFLRRDRARVGDRVFVTGTLGDAAGGLRCRQALAEAGSVAGQASEQTALIARLDRPLPRIDAGMVLRELAHACIDVSDGLLADLGHIAIQSGVGIDIDEDGLPASAALSAVFDRETCRAFQLGGGDDYELAFTIAEGQIEAMRAGMSRIGCAVACIGRVVSGQGVRVLDANGRPRDCAHPGWEHFA
jgi:thiamine-monophosphate kinase